MQNQIWVVMLVKLEYKRRKERVVLKFDIVSKDFQGKVKWENGV